ncbi:MAG: zinc protease [Parvicellaceae bacterium]|jgi:zinc protease
MIDRSIIPELSPIESVRLPQPNISELDNGIPVYTFDLADQELVKIEVVFKSGSAHELKELIADSTANMMRHGTTSKTAREIANKIDYLGSFLEYSVGKDFTSFSLFCLTKYVEDSLGIFADVLMNPTFPEDELEIQLRNDLQSFQVNSDKVSVICRKSFGENLFDSNHSYYSSITDESFSLKASSLQDHYNSKYNLKNAEIFVSGFVKEDVFKALNANFGKSFSLNSDHSNIEVANSSLPNSVLIKKEGAIQSAIRIGKLLPFGRTSDEYIPFTLLNTVLGGYFSSRLMANIREDKGYTYGVGSGVIANLAATTFLISTEVNGDATRATIEEVHKEIKILQAELIDDDELNRVKQYIVGSFLRNSDGPFDICERFKSTHLFGMDYDYYQKYLARIQAISAQELNDLANKHLQIDEMLEVVAGKI